MHEAGSATRWVEVAPERLQRWLQGFAEHHGELRWSAAADGATLRVDAADGAVAECLVPFPPLRADTGAPFGGLPAHALRERVVGVLLVRLGGFAAGVFEGTHLVASKVGSRPVHGRSAAGGWSQQRFARRREGQAHVALEAAADVAARILLPHLDRLDAVVLGGDRRALDTVLDDPRLAPLRALHTATLADVPTPDRRVLLSMPDRYRAVRVQLRS